MTVTIKLDVPLEERLRQRAASTGRSTSDVIRAALLAYLDQPEADAARSAYALGEDLFGRHAGASDLLALYLDLIRWNRPAGWLLLLWPTLSRAVDRRRRLSGLAPADGVRARHHPDAQRRLLHQRRGRPRVRPPRQAHRAAPGDQRRSSVRRRWPWAPCWRSSPSAWC
jgi:predicted transcriptional regulator